MTASAQLLRFAVEGGRVRRAASALEQASPELASALRRAMPFLVRRGGQVALCFARALPVSELLDELPRPVHATHLLAPSGARGALILDSGAISMVLDGVLGGDGQSPPVLDRQGLTPPQIALIARVIDGAVRSLSDVLSRKFGFALQAISPDVDEASSEGAPIACSFDIGVGTQTGRVVLLIAKEALLGTSDEAEVQTKPPDRRVARIVEDVELDLVVELARLQMTIGRLSALKAGDVIRLDVPVGAAVDVRADGHIILRGHPTTNAGQIAIRLAGRHAS
ncbi:MAG: FliM/FliN family flagellar motor switch protein [Polyangiaceae bacterium]|jgi:flagellar motor switch protein FliM